MIGRLHSWCQKNEAWSVLVKPSVVGGIWHTPFFRVEINNGKMYDGLLVMWQGQSVEAEPPVISEECCFYIFGTFFYFLWECLWLAIAFLSFCRDLFCESDVMVTDRTRPKALDAQENVLMIQCITSSVWVISVQLSAKCRSQFSQ